MQREIINYLSANKEKYTKEDLIEALIKSGYKKQDINEAWQSLTSNKKSEPNSDKNSGASKKKFDYKDKKFIFSFIITILVLIFLHLISNFLEAEAMQAHGDNNHNILLVDIISGLFSLLAIIYLPVISIPIFFMLFRKNKNLLFGFIFGFCAYYYFKFIIANFSMKYLFAK